MKEMYCAFSIAPDLAARPRRYFPFFSTQADSPVCSGSVKLMVHRLVFVCAQDHDLGPMC